MLQLRSTWSPYVWVQSTILHPVWPVRTFEGALHRPGAVQPLWYTGAHLLLPTELHEHVACICGWGGGRGVVPGIMEGVGSALPVSLSPSPHIELEQDVDQGAEERKEENQEKNREEATVPSPPAQWELDVIASGEGVH